MESLKGYLEGGRDDDTLLRSSPAPVGGRRGGNPTPLGGQAPRSPMDYVHQARGNVGLAERVKILYRVAAPRSRSRRRGRAIRDGAAAVEMLF